MFDKIIYVLPKKRIIYNFDACFKNANDDGFGYYKN